MRICDGNSPADSQFSGEGGRRCAPGAKLEIPAAHGADHGEAAALLQPMEVNRGAIHQQPVEETPPEPTLERDPGRTYGSVEGGAHDGEDLLAGPETL